MPSLAKISSTFFVELINRLGIRPPFSEGFEISNVVQPVSLVDSNIILQATTSSQVCDTSFTAGESVAPAANTRLVNTGAQTAGTYAAKITLSTGGETNDWRIRRRNAADAADIWVIRFRTSTYEELNLTVVLQTNERLVAENVGAGGAGVVYNANIWLQKLG